MPILSSFVGVVVLPLGLAFSFLLHHIMAPSFAAFHALQEHAIPHGFEFQSESSTWRNLEGEKVRQQLLEVLASRRRQPVEPPELLPAEPRLRPYLEEEAAAFFDPEVLALCPKAERARRHNTLEIEEENRVLRVEAGEQGKIPFLIIRPKWHHSRKRRPVVICMHGTGHNKESMRPFMEAYAALGFVAVAVDARYHGERGRSQHAYMDALIAGWKTGLEMPFVFDTVWDVIKIVDYLTGRPDVDPERIGMMGISLGGMETWFTAVADPRISAALPLIGVQNFGWAVLNDHWQGRVYSIIEVFLVAAQDLGKDEIDSETVAAVWRRLAPGLMDYLDSPFSVPAIAPRPLLVYNGQEDPRCPIQGLGTVLLRTVERYKEAGVPENFKFIAEEGLAHAVSQEMGDTAIRWFKKHLRAWRSAIAMSVPRSMDEVHHKLSLLHYPRSSAPSQSLLYAGLERYALLDWLFFRLLGDKSPFTSQQGLLTEGADRDEEAARIQYLAEIAKYLGLTPSVDPDAIQGKGSYESRAEMLHLIVELVEASTVTDNPEWSVDDQVAKDILLVDAIAEKQTQVFSDECKLFPADVPIISYGTTHDIIDLERQLSEQVKSVEQLQASVAELSAKQSYNPNEDYTDAEIELRARLATFLDSAKSFNVIYAKEIRPWTHMMDVPQLHGLGPAANRLLDSYGQLLRLLRNLQKMRDSYSAVAAGSDVASDVVVATTEESSLVKLVAECEEALLLLNNGLSILSLSLERDFH